MMCRRNILHALLSPHKQYVNSVCSQNWTSCMNGCGLSSFQSIHLHNILLTKIAFQKSQWFPLKTLVKWGNNNNNINNNTSLIWCRWPVVQGLGRAYQDKQDFYWCAEATLARCPSCCHQWIIWVPAVFIQCVIKLCHLPIHWIRLLTFDQQNKFCMKRIYIICCFLFPWVNGYCTNISSAKSEIKASF